MVESVQGQPQDPQLGVGIEREQACRCQNESILPLTHTNVLLVNR